MRGTHQQESPLMKFTPEVAESVREYQTQQYTRHTTDSEQFDLSDNVSSGHHIEHPSTGKSNPYNKAV